MVTDKPRLREPIRAIVPPYNGLSYLVEVIRKLSYTKHGHWENNQPTKTYRAWVGMKARCDNPNTIGWDNYGGRGIAYDPRWADFENFLADIGEIPEGYSLDRIDVDGNYCPGNVRLATATEQQRNRRDNVTATIDGQTKTLAEWSEISGIPKRTLFGRRERGWPDEKLLQKESGRETLVTIRGVTQPIKAWAKQSGLLSSTICKRLKAGWHTDDVLAPSQKAS